MMLSFSDTSLHFLEAQNNWINMRRRMAQRYFGTSTFGGITSTLKVSSQSNNQAQIAPFRIAVRRQFPQFLAALLFF